MHKMQGQMDRAIRYKIERLAQGRRPRVLDLFAGCGGLSLGFHAAGFCIEAAVECDPLAARSYASNFHRLPDGSPDPRHASAKDIVQTEPDHVVDELGLGDPGLAFDVIVGGPPCQAFARIGRAKLREIGAHPEAYRQDHRAGLYTRYLDYIRQCKPLAILMENVPDILSFGGRNIPEEMCQLLSGPEYGYTAGYALLNSVHYGVPQMRQRCFLFAYRREIAQAIELPEPTHHAELPRGYDDSRRAALKMVDLFGRHYIEPPVAGADLPPAVTAREAIGDLPSITGHLEGRIGRGTRRFTDVIAYGRHEAPSGYARQMRGWRGFSNAQGVKDHVIRWLPRDYRIFARMEPGDEYPAALGHAEQLLRDELERLRRQGLNLESGSPDYLDQRKKFVPPYDPGKFPNKWWKLRPDAPVRTIMAHIGKDSYSHIHYDADQARTISVREAARLQSFPDGFVFEGTMNPAFRQIGNAVPPLMAMAIATKMRRTLADVLGSNFIAAAE